MVLNLAVVLFILYQAIAIVAENMWLMVDSGITSGSAIGKIY